MRRSLLPGLLLVLAGLLVAAFTITDYGASWDEPEFYQYAADAARAYNPQNWVRPDFRIQDTFGPTDHYLYGPAYLLLGEVVRRVSRADAWLGPVDSWHLINFVTFQAGVLLLYGLCRRWMSDWAAFGAALLYATQPLLWGHAFINPKDVPFVTFFLAAVSSGMWMVEAPHARAWFRILVAGVILGLLAAIRVIGPAAGALVVWYFVLRLDWRRVTGAVVYAATAVLTMVAAWPYLWQAPIGHFRWVLKHMAANPGLLDVLFNGQVFRSNALPASYLPVEMFYTLTEPIALLAAAGLVWSGLRIWRGRLDWRSLSVVGLWFAVPFVYVVVRRPPMYDGWRHFLFILPPVFIVCGLALDAIGQWLQSIWSRSLLLAVVTASGVIGMIQIHPYEYAYFNRYAGGITGAFRRFETDYWLTCYKEIMPMVNQDAASHPTLFVLRRPENAQLYAGPHVKVEPFDPGKDSTAPGDLLLLPTRSNADLVMHPDAPVVYDVGRDGATFCVVKRVR